MAPFTGHWRAGGVCSGSGWRYLGRRHCGSPGLMDSGIGFATCGTFPATVSGRNGFVLTSLLRLRSWFYVSRHKVAIFASESAIQHSPSTMPVSWFVETMQTISTSVASWNETFCSASFMSSAMQVQQTHSSQSYIPDLPNEPESSRFSSGANSELMSDARVITTFEHTRLRSRRDRPERCGAPPSLRHHQVFGQ